MSNDKKDEQTLVQELEHAEKQVMVGGTYAHYKHRGMTYTVIALGFQEATEQLQVIYQANYGQRIIFIRPLDSWLDQVEYQEETVSRFSRILS